MERGVKLLLAAMGLFVLFIFAGDYFIAHSPYALNKDAILLPPPSNTFLEPTGWDGMCLPA